MRMYLLMVRGRKSERVNVGLTVNYDRAMVMNNAKMHVHVCYALFSAQDDNVSPQLRIVEKFPLLTSDQQVRRLRSHRTAHDRGVGARLPPALLFDRLPADRATNVKLPTKRAASLLLRSIAKRQPFQCLVNVVACWKR